MLAASRRASVSASTSSALTDATMSCTKAQLASSASLSEPSCAPTPLTPSSHSLSSTAGTRPHSPLAKAGAKMSTVACSEPWLASACARRPCSRASGEPPPLRCGGADATHCSSSSLVSKRQAGTCCDSRPPSLHSAV